MVQGVGFRPFVYRLAHEFGIKGWVENRNDGVIIHAEGTVVHIESFLDAFHTQAPPASSVSHVSHDEVTPEGFSDFVIVKSENASDQVTDISPDIAVCDNCLADLKIQPHRLELSFYQLHQLWTAFFHHKRFALRPAQNNHGSICDV